jgi:hypothetical protein
MNMTARIRRQTRALWRMTRAMGSPRRVIPARSLSLTVSALVLVGLLVLFSSFSSAAQAQGPVGNAMQTIVAATVEAQETQAAQAAQAASQRATASALDIQMRQAAATATRAALDQQAADAQMTRAAESARATQTAAAQATTQAAQATMAALQAHATATEAARRDAFATAQALAAQADATRIAGVTATIEAIHVDATRTALALSAQNAERDAQFQTLFSGSVVAIAWLLAALLFLLLVKQLRSSKPRPVVVVSDPALSDSAQEVPADASRVPPERKAEDEPHSFVIEDPRAARAIAQMIAEQMGDPQVEVDHDADPLGTNPTESR